MAKVKTKLFYKKKAWKAFSRYIRIKYMDRDGNVQCYTCYKLYPFQKIQAGHGIGGRNNSILFNEDLVRPQCVGCNVFGRGKYAIFTRRLIDDLGLGKYDELVNNSQEVVQFKSNQYEEIEQNYLRKLEIIINDRFQIKPLWLKD